MTVRVGLIGDRCDDLRPHVAIPRALELVTQHGGPGVAFEWLATERIASAAPALLEPFDALWCVPGGPYASMDGALAGIRFAREQRRPFLGTCGGFQHTLIEYARHVLGLSLADHAESNPTAEVALIHRLACSLAGARRSVQLVNGSSLAAIYGATSAVESYNCNYGLDPRFAPVFATSDLRVIAVDDNGEARAVELRGHPFFVATLFQPELSAFESAVHPLVRAFVSAATSAAARRDPLAP